MNRRTPPTKETAAKLVVVDDDAYICRLIARIAEPFNTSVDTIVSLDESSDMQRLVEADMLLLDLGMPGLDGIEVLRRLAAQDCRARIILISGAAPGVLESSSRLGRQLNLEMGPPISKPFDVDDLRQLIGSANGAGSEAGPPGPGNLSAAIDAGEIIPHYQPKVDLETQRIIGVEALARWTSEEFGAVSPETFIPLAEEAQLMDVLTRSTFQTAFRDLAVISEARPGFKLSLNLSPSQLTDLRYPDLMHRYAMEAGIDPDQITIEVTESEAMRHPTRYMDILIRFRLKGFHLSVDDFGTGFSSLDHLYQLPFEELKIDKTFVQGLGQRESAAVIVKTIIALANGLGMSSIAEGIEDEQTRNTLLDFGCRQGQGYHFSKALPVDGLMALLSGEESDQPRVDGGDGGDAPFAIKPAPSIGPSKRAS